ncbi:hypothetical protein BDQ17DRAFT_1372111 [Cyathus striatus]|nr:hypothetical protein BDQ17DRAFT_1372111 [Cyathus striatus]
MSLLVVPHGTLHSLQASRYLAGGFLSAMIWDHLTTLDREVYLIWKSGASGGSKWMIRIAFTFNRYGNEAFLVFIAYVTSGIHVPSPHLCRSLLIFIAFCGPMMVQISHFALVLRLYALTDQRRAILYCLIAGFCVAMFISYIFAVLTTIALKHQPIFVQDGFNSCIITTNPKDIIGVIAPMCAFDIFIILVTVYNALDRPYRSNAELFISLYKDGAKYFLGNTAIHLIFLLTAIYGPTDAFFILLFAGWALVAVLVSRIHLKMEKFRNSQRTSSGEEFLALHPF